MNPHDLDRPLRVLRVCLHLLLAGLLALAAVRAVVDGVAEAAAVVTVAVVMAAVYAVGPMLPRVGRSPVAAACWLGVLGVMWLVLLWLTPDGVWLAFPLFFLQLHLLPRRWGLPAVGVSTALAVAAFSWHEGAFAAGFLIGPVLGAAVAVATVLGYQALYQESEHRKALIDELRSTRDELAAAERSAGMLAERERLAREIHDTLAQGLSSIQLLLRAAERALPEHGELASEHVVRARQTAHDNLQEARRFVRALAPADLEGRSLPGALERLCTTTAQRTGLDVRFRLDGEPCPLATADEVAVLRIAQSALSNTVRHAGARHAEVALRCAAAEVTLRVTDDGAGFDPGAVPAGTDPEGGFGLTAMRSRARSLGGTLGVESAPGRGATLTLSLPREGDARREGGVCRCQT